MGCQNKIELPTFFNNDYEQTDIVNTTYITEAITLYSKNKITTLSFQKSVSEFENHFIAQLEHVKPMTPQFFIEMEQELELLYNQSKKFSPVMGYESNYLKNTFVRLCLFMLERMGLSDASLVLKMYLRKLDFQPKDYDAEYKIRIVEAIVEYLLNLNDVAVPKNELDSIKLNLHEAKTPKLSRKGRQGIKYLMNRIESLIFLIDERIMSIEVLREEILLAREHFIERESSFDLINSIKDVKSNLWLAVEDYPFVFGNGYVEVMPTETYRVRQYGKDTNKTYIFEEKTFKYKRTQDKWVYGVHTLNNSSMNMKVGRYITEMEVFRLSKYAYLLGSEVLLLER